MPWGKKDEEPSTRPEEEGTSVLAADLVVEGTVGGRGLLRIEGVVRGQIRHDGQLVIAEGADVQADIEGRDVLIMGRVRGSITILGRLEIRPTARVEGEIRAERVTVAEGATVVGRIESGRRADGEVEIASPATAAPLSTG
jgi:cytoskeletal protein CcmA (bactofilin family)